MAPDSRLPNVVNTQHLNCRPARGGCLDVQAGVRSAGEDELDLTCFFAYVCILFIRACLFQHVYSRSRLATPLWWPWFCQGIARFIAGGPWLMAYLKKYLFQPIFLPVRSEVMRKTREHDQASKVVSFSTRNCGFVVFGLLHASRWGLEDNMEPAVFRNIPLFSSLPLEPIEAGWIGRSGLESLKEPWEPSPCCARMHQNLFAKPSK